MTYNVFSGTLNPTQSVNQPVTAVLYHGLDACSLNLDQAIDHWSSLSTAVLGRFSA